MSEIVLEGVTKVFDDGYEAVKDMNLDIGDGEFMILVGPSGCGKSTALRMIAGLEDITSGELKIDGEEVNDRSPKDRDIAMVFQNYALYPHMTVRENMGFALKLAGDDKAEIDQKVEEAAKTLDLEAAPRPAARQPLRRPAPAGGDGAGDRPQPESVPDGRAALQPRRQAAGADAHRGRANPVGSRNDDRLRHPRPDRGDDPRRPGRGDAGRRPAAGRQPGRALRRAAQPLRRRLHRLAGDELHARRDQRRQTEAAARRGRRVASCRAAATRAR